MLHPEGGAPSVQTGSWASGSEPDGPWVSDRTKLSFFICKMKTMTVPALFVHLWELNNTSEGLPLVSNMVYLLSKYWLLLVLREQRNSMSSHP